MNKLNFNIADFHTRYLHFYNKAFPSDYLELSWIFKPYIYWLLALYCVISSKKRGSQNFTKSDGVCLGSWDPHENYLKNLEYDPKNRLQIDLGQVAQNSSLNRSWWRRVIISENETPCDARLIIRILVKFPSGKQNIYIIIFKICIWDKIL